MTNLSFLPVAAGDWHVLDTSILIAFFAAMVGIIVWVLKQREETSQDYFLAGRKAKWLEIGSSIFSSNIGSEHLVGLAGAGFVSGMAMAHWEMHAWMILVLGWVFVPFYDRIKIFTMPEFLEHRFSSRTRTVLSMISLVSYILTKVAVTVYSGGVVFGTVFGIDSIEIMGRTVDFFWVSAIGLVVITGIYTILGGMKAIMYTSVLQTPVLLIGSVALLVLGLNAAGGWGNVVEACGDNIHLIRPHDDPEFPWTGVVFGSMIIGFWYWCTDQYVVQRVLSGKNQTQARRGAILAGYLKLLPVFIFLIPGMIAFALFKQGKMDVESSDAAFATLVSHILPIGFRGIVVCGLLAALMSSLASLFNSSAALFVGDFYKKYKPEASEKNLVIVGRIATGTIVLLGILWIPVMKVFSNVLYEYLQAVQGLLAPAIASVFIMGVFWKRTTPAGGYWGLTIGFILGMFRLVLNVMYGAKNGVVIQAAKLKDRVLSITADSHIDIMGKLETLKQGIAEHLPNAGGEAQMQVQKAIEALKAGGDGTQASELLAKSETLLSQLFVQQHGLLYRIAAINWLHFCIILFLLCIAITVVVSLMTAAPTPQQQHYTYFSATKEEREETRRSWNKWDIIHSAIILGIVIAFYAYFW
ncbi:Na(+)/glucose symporter [Sedimentisphaera salicampi]|uniref:Na(+)/glucose symporter n=1 Tax=Sedimentisphaera salicampi TaxID=1941349 RepID=A0A1W6LJ56_9BACT|nr:sodium:solute symporter [Sedimentisphaera salicampi]ARN55817.1 Na(+)/glucose symporter [Sedimentisphaera salicampi]OXU16010.1 Na(+)/glucose symporter [Sedimentisphaera salicampi]